MQQDLDTAYPLLDIEILGINEVGMERGNNTITALGDIPWLQDIDSDGNSISDVWYDSWDITYRDVVVLDADNVPFGVYNLTQNSLSVPENYATLRQMFLDASLQDPGLAWQNPNNHSDVDDNGEVAPLDVLMLINQLNKFGAQPLPYRGSGGQPPERFYDSSGDGQLTPLDALIAINHINKQTATASVAGQPTGVDQQVAAAGAMNVSPVPASDAGTDATGATDAALNGRVVEAAFADPEFDLLLAQSTEKSRDEPCCLARPREASLSRAPAQHEFHLAVTPTDLQHAIAHEPSERSRATELSF